MSDDRTEADRILGEGWREPSRVLFETAWAEHPKKPLLDRLAAERDEHGMPTFETHIVFENDMAIYVLRPADDDERPSVHIFAWHLSVLERGNADARAVVAEHDEAAWSPAS